MRPSVVLDADVLVSDQGADAVLLRREGQRPLLVLRPHQSFGAACRAVQAVEPDAPADDVRQLVRTHLPNAVDLDEILPAPSYNTAAEFRREVTEGLHVTAVVALTINMLLAVGFYLIHVEPRARLNDLRDERPAPRAVGHPSSGQQLGAPTVADAPSLVGLVRQKGGSSVA